MNNLNEINEEIRRVRDAIKNSNSPYLKRDYKKYLNELYKERSKYIKYRDE